MQNLLNLNYVGSNNKREKVKRCIMTKIKRSSSNDLKLILYPLTSKTANILSFRQKFNSRRRSTSISYFTHDQELNRQQKCIQIQIDNKEQQQPNEGDGNSKPSSNNIITNKQWDDLNNIYERRKNDVNFRQFIQHFQQDALQLEALYYQLSFLEFHLSAPLQLPPILCYFLYTLIMYRDDKRKLFNQFSDTYFGDDYYKKLRKFQGRYFKQKLQNQCISQISFYNEPEEESILHELMFFYYLDNLIPNLDLDYSMLLDDFLSYFSLSNIKKNFIELSMRDDNILRKNNIAFGNIRFVFKKKDGLFIDFKQPIGRFENIQFLDYVQFQADFTQQVSSAEPIKYFNSYRSEPHSERTMILFLLADIYLNQSIFQHLKLDLIDSQQINNIINLSQIYLEITSEKRVCKNCLGMFQQIPIEFICQKFQETFGLGVDTRFQFIITQQYLLDPKISTEKERYQRIWVRTTQKKFNSQYKFLKDQKKNSEDFQKENQQEIPLQLIIEQNDQNDENDCELVQKQDLPQQDSKQSHQQEDLIKQEYLICYEEQEPTGLISVLFLKERYCKSQVCNFKTKIPDIKLTNTFFINNESQFSDTISQNSFNQDENSQSSKQIKYQKQQNRLLDQLQKKQYTLIHHMNFKHNNPEEQNLQKTKKPYTIYEDLLLEIQSEFYSYLIRKFTSDFQMFDTELFELDKILQLYWEIGLLKGQQNGLMNILKEKLMLNSILDCGQFNLKLFIQDYQFISECRTTQITNEMKSNQQSSKTSANFYILKFYGLNESGEFKRIALSIQGQSCYQLIQQFDEQLQEEIKKFKRLIIIILSINQINNQCTETIYNHILNLQHPKFELKHYFFEQNTRDQTQKERHKSTSISEQQLILLEKDFFLHRYALQDQNCFQPFKELSEKFDQELMSFECQVHTWNVNS
ncbi:unnamed protein product (macronuclear) [Paramecium tetraurelia]|uniref:Uncharacterized protein n=1 Tax=Paramecium tetraurelia TaxID=5888 RepID=A0CFH9_PARTE|nr:uncharacterized protein GSPATT00037985001 [Paramecium tetraurelia]CAK69546.1 unnamed protein product [Paramecium tetraurelia]|eukprot:XP_001436943.1 hypothetical protein (macronuclear) [Paramecium tetraurelia strain d4-2]